MKLEIIDMGILQALETLSVVLQKVTKTRNEIIPFRFLPFR